MKRLPLSFILLLLGLTSLWAGQKDTCRIPLAAPSSVTIDGKVNDGEYAATYADGKTGITVCWQTDSLNLYCALQSPGQGWLSIGFGSPGMNGADMIIAFIDDKGKWTVEEHEGKSFFRHSKYKNSKLINAKAGLINGKTVMEFCLPLKLSNGQEISFNQPLPFILAYHQSKTSLSKHSKKSSGLLVLTSGQ